MHNYQRIWKQDRQFLGAEGMPAPLVVLNTPKGPKGAGASTGPDARGGRTIFLAPGTTRNLHVTRGEKVGAPRARALVEHEFARVYQGDNIMVSGGANKGGQSANNLAKALARHRNSGGGNPERYARKHLPYFGQNPQTIPWPVTPPAD